MKPVLIRKFFFVALIVFGAWACKKDPPAPPPVVPDTQNPESVDSVTFNLNEVPYPLLSDYGFFTGNLADLNPAARVLPYDVITPLFSDYAKKKRFVWMPEGVSAEFVADHQLLTFEDGTVLIKNFYYENVQPEGNTRLLETRLMYKKAGEWHFANYIWNQDQTEALLDTDLNGQVVPLEYLNESGVMQLVDYRIPAGAECQTCHKSFDAPVPIGLKPQNINKTYQYADETTNQLLKWQQSGYLSGGIPASVNAVAAWDDETADLTERVRAYLDMNCAHCHTDGGHCDYRMMRFAYHETVVDENMGVCVEPEEFVEPQHVHIISAGNIDKSVLHFRLNTTVENYRMPLLGRTVVHEEAVSLLTEYINSIEEPCN